MRVTKSAKMADIYIPSELKEFTGILTKKFKNIDELIKFLTKMSENPKIVFNGYYCNEFYTDFDKFRSLNGQKLHKFRIKQTYKDSRWTNVSITLLYLNQ